MRAPIGVCLTAKNETDSLVACLESIRSFVHQVVVVVDRNCDLETYYIAKEYADILEEFNGCLDELGQIVDFGAIRQRAHSLVTEPWAMWIDADDVLVGAEHLHDVIATAGRNKRPVQIFCPYDYSRGGQGRAPELFYRERLVSPPDAFSWNYPVHEVLLPKEVGTKSRIDHRLVWRHQPPSEEAPSWQRNLRILHYHAQRGPLDSRLQYYMGVETANAGDLGSARTRLEQFLSNAPADDDKRLLAYTKLVELTIQQGLPAEGIQYGHAALTYRRSFEAYALMAKAYYFLALQSDRVSDWEKCVYFGKTALTLDPTPSLFLGNPNEAVFDLHAFLNYALFKTGDICSALVSTQEALKIRPDPYVDQNRQLYESLVTNRP